MNKEYIEIGKIVNTHGIKGEVKVYPWTDSPDIFEVIDHIYIKGYDTPFKISGIKFHKNMVILSLFDINSIAQAEGLKDNIIYASRSSMPPLPEGVHYIKDLLGFRIVTISGEKLGVLSDIFNTGSNDVYVVKTNDNKEILLPKIDEVVKDINVTEGIITVNIIEGLL